ncbi:hypothetical protein CLV35_3703 [Motilibacter peucedani]|uniref:PknH-like protein n=1 Tax=Motilibacter peucedani TaxID=598650 RepID=A0A420XKY4_9ACTN|nr:hypothetical protein [Motilibacter peucedani]RKS68575.1 hypothetical protein CLV35_3703 [Motilibacter peucedani]
MNPSGSSGPDNVPRDEIDDLLVAAMAHLADAAPRPGRRLEPAALHRERTRRTRRRAGATVAAIAATIAVVAGLPALVGHSNTRRSAPALPPVVAPADCTAFHGENDGIDQARNHVHPLLASSALLHPEDLTGTWSSHVLTQQDTAVFASPLTRVPGSSAVATASGFLQRADRAPLWQVYDSVAQYAPGTTSSAFDHLLAVRMCEGTPVDLRPRSSPRPAQGVRVLVDEGTATDRVVAFVVEERVAMGESGGDAWRVLVRHGDEIGLVRMNRSGGGSDVRKVDPDAALLRQIGTALLTRMAGRPVPAPATFGAVSGPAVPPAAAMLTAADLGKGWTVQEGTALPASNLDDFSHDCAAQEDGHAANRSVVLSAPTVVPRGADGFENVSKFSPGEAASFVARVRRHLSDGCAAYLERPPAADEVGDDLLFMRGRRPSQQDVALVRSGDVVVEVSFPVDGRTAAARSEWELAVARAALARVNAAAATEPSPGSS